jgi:hypothetical protein
MNTTINSGSTNLLKRFGFATRALSTVLALTAVSLLLNPNRAAAGPFAVTTISPNSQTVNVGSPTVTRRETSVWRESFAHSARALGRFIPHSEPVRNLGLARSPDSLTWPHALNAGFIIVPKAGDFHHLSFIRGAPPGCNRSSSYSGP